MEPDVTLRPLADGDMRMLFEWRNLEGIIALSSSRRAVTWEEHTAWFRRILNSTDCIVFIIMSGNEPIGQARFDLEEKDRAVISIYLLPQHCGRGLGTRALRLADDKLHAARPDVAAVHAKIRSDNRNSIASFAKAGFVLAESAHADVDHVLMVLPLHSSSRPEHS